jgi:Sec-independent protein translocase protein TatA
MGFGGISIWSLLLILAIVILLFGTMRLRSFGSFLSLTAVGSPKSQVFSAIPRNETNSVSHAERARDDIYDQFSNALKQTKVKGEIYKSPPYNDSIWVVVQIQDPVQGSENLSLRASAEVIITPLDFRSFDHKLTITLKDGRKQKRHRTIVEFGNENAVAVCQYLAGQTGRLTVKFKKYRVFPWQLWRPKNKLAGVKRIYNFPAYVAIGGLLLMGIHVLGIPIFLIGSIWWVIEWYNRRNVLSLTTGKPPQEPRTLLRLDSWQTVLYDIVPYAEEFKNQIREKLIAGAELGSAERGEQSARVEVSTEHIWHQGVDGKVEREQLVVQLRRAIGFVHVYTYGGDLYVGWDAHLNGGSWVEKNLGEFWHQRSGKKAQVYGIQPDWHTPNEYDITDTNFLLEMIHSVVTKVIKQALAEHKIDQEIDFSIVREGRTGLAGSDKPGGKKSQKSRFLRVG